MQVHKTLCLLPGLLLPLQLVMAQPVPVVEAGGDARQGQQAAAQPAAAPNNQNDVVVNMYLQLEALQNEVQNLRGLVEEQSYQIRRMQTEQRDRYLDIDSRLVELQNRTAAGNAGPSRPLTQAPGSSSNGTNGQGNATGQANAGNGANVANSADQVAGNTGTADNTPRTERDVYRQALALLLEKEEYQDAITLFQQYIDVYPQGQYYTNSLYWLGAALELVGNYNRAIDVLMQLINNYPEDAKAPTAMLRLGTVYREMGRTPEAVATWQRISEQYPDSTSEIEIANEYLSDVNNF